MKVLRVQMPDGVWEIPAQVIAESRATYYSTRERDPEPFDAIAEETLLDGGLITDWAENNMDWADVEKHAVLIAPASRAVDYQKHWGNAKKTVVMR